MPFLVGLYVTVSFGIVPVLLVAAVTVPVPVAHWHGQTRSVL